MASSSSSLPSDDHTIVETNGRNNQIAMSKTPRSDSHGMDDGSERSSKDEVSDSHGITDGSERPIKDEISCSPIVDDCDRCMLNIEAIAHADLSVVYRPRIILLVKVPNLPWGRAVRLKHSEYQTASNGECSLVLQTRFVDYDGEYFRELPLCLRIAQYTGLRDIRTLGCVPLSLYKKEEEARELLVTRGNEFHRLTKRRCVMQYNSAAHYTGRVVVDYSGIKGISALLTNELQLDFDSFPIIKRENGNLIEEDLLVLAPTIVCLSVPGAQVVRPNIEELEPTEWNNRCFDKDELVLDSLATKTFKALIEAHPQAGLLGEIEGKGLIFVLYGPPGVGKTRTVECCAEYIERPLFTLKSGWVGAEDSGISQYGIVDPTMLMSASMVMCGVLLVKDADQFLDNNNRNAPAFKRFWQELEQHPSIVFLVARSRPTFDGPSASIIRLSKRYNRLNNDSRKKIWRILCSKVSDGVIVTDEEYSKLAETRLNGHQVKSVIETAQALALHDEKRVDFECLKDALTTQEVLEEEDWSRNMII